MLSHPRASLPRLGVRGAGQLILVTECRRSRGRAHNLPQKNRGSARGRGQATIWERWGCWDAYDSPKSWRNARALPVSSTSLQPNLWVAGGVQRPTRQIASGEIHLMNWGRIELFPAPGGDSIRPNDRSAPAETTRET